MDQVEKDLILEYLRLKSEVAHMKDQLEKAREELGLAEGRLYDTLVNQGKKRSAFYEGLGFVGISDPRIYASCSPEYTPELIEWLGSVGRSDCVKPSVHPKTLSVFVKEFLELGNEIPEFVSYYTKPTVRFYSRPEG